MPAPTLINLTTGDDTYTAAAGDYAIIGVGGNDTITTGAGNSSVTTGTGNSTITTGAGDSLVHTLDGNQTITTGAGNSTVITGNGNSTITTGAGINTVQAGNGNNTITTGAGASHVTTGTGDDTITTGAGDAVVDSGTGNDTVTTAAGNDLVSYHVTGNAGHHSLFNAGTGIDTLNLVLTRAEWMSDAVQTDVTSYLSFLAANKGATGEDSAAAYTFKAFGLTASMFEKLRVTVDGVVLQDATNHSVALHNDAISTTEKVASLALNVLANDAVPDLIKSFSFTNPAHGSVHLDAAYLATASAPSAQFIYTPTAGFYDYLAVGQSASDAFTYTVTDAAGGVSTATVNVTINGTNDAPVITSAVLTGAVIEQVLPAGSLTSSGAINFSDVDLSDVHSVSAAAASGTLGTLTANVSTDDSHSTGLGGQVSWSYSVANSLVQYLAAGETKLETFTVSLSDGHGGLVPSTVSVIITGTNEPAVISGTSTGSVTENTTLTASGNLTVTDVDQGQAVFQAQTGIVGTYGSFGIGVNGNWTYALNNNAANVQALSAANHVSDAFTVLSQDGTASQRVTVTVNGLDKFHAPVALDDAISGGYLTFEPGTYARSNYSVSTNGIKFDSATLLQVTGYWGVDNSSALQPMSSDSGRNSFTMTSADGSSFAFQSANLYAWGGGTNDPDTETITGYLNGVQVAQQISSVPDRTWGGSHTNVLAITAPGFNSVDKVVFDLVNNRTFSIQMVDNVSVFNLVTQTRDINVLFNDTDVDANAHLSVASFSAFSVHGAAISLNTDGTLHYNPKVSAELQALSQGAVVHDSFTYQAQEAHGLLSNTATVRIDLIGLAHTELL